MVNADAWIRRAYLIKARLRQAKTRKSRLHRIMKNFDTLANEYEDARNAAYASDKLKARIDTLFTQLMRQTRKMRPIH
jgi:hypothetical protein